MGGVLPSGWCLFSLFSFVLLFFVPLFFDHFSLVSPAFFLLPACPRCFRILVITILFLKLLLGKMTSTGDRISAFISQASLPGGSLLQALAAMIICGGSATDWSHQPADADQVGAEGFSDNLKLSKGVLKLVQWFHLQNFAFFLAHWDALALPIAPGLPPILRHLQLNMCIIHCDSRASR